METAPPPRGVDEPVITLVIPAHNEAVLIGDTLGFLLKDARPGEFAVVVACNGCTDGTAAIARGFGPAVTVVETDGASKTAALNLGDRAARGFPRFYLDADVRVGAEDLRRTAHLLQRPGVLAASPTLQIDLTGCSWPVRAFYRAWLRRPYFRQGHLGSGVYGVSAAGRERFGAFPDVIADDDFFRLQFAPHERANADDAFFRIRAPRRIAGVVKVKTRSRLGRIELRHRFPGLKPDPPAAGTGRTTPRPPPRTAPHRSLLLIDTAVFALVQAATAWRARRQHAAGETTWERDHSTRVPTAPAT